LFWLGVKEVCRALDRNAQAQGRFQRAVTRFVSGLLSPGLAAKTTCVIPFSSRRPQTTERFGGGQNPVLHFAAFFAGLPSKGQEIERQIAV